MFLFLGFCTWEPNFCAQKLWKFHRFPPFWVQKCGLQVQKPHVSGAIFSCFGCKNDMFWVQFLNRLGANKLTLFELEPFEIAVASIFNKLESRICTQTRTKLHSKNVIFAPKACKNWTWNLGFLHLKNLFLHPKTAKCSPFSGENFTILGAKIKILGAKTQKPVQKQWNFHYFCTIFAPLLCKNWCKKTVKFSLFLHLAGAKASWARCLPNLRDPPCIKFFGHKSGILTQFL